MSDALHVDHLWKEYRLGVFGQGMLFKDIQSWWAGVRGKDDPNAPLSLGANDRRRSNDRIWALNDVSMTVKQGEVLGIIGKNGAGKSTLLKIISRVTAPTRGEVRIKGRLASLLEVGTGFHPELSGKENVYLNGAILGMTVREIDQRLEEIVDFAGIGRFVDTPVKRYSSGMYVRLAFAVAAHLEPEILVVDEVLAVGDVEFQRKCLAKMETISGAGRTILFVSHNMAAIRNLCDRVILLDLGSISIDGGPSEVIDRYLEGSSVSQAVLAGTELEEKVEDHCFLGKPLFRAREIAVLDRSGEARLRFASNEDIVISIGFECIEDVNDLRVEVYLHDREGLPLLRTDFYDHESSNGLRVFRKGAYRLKCRLPGNTFGQRLFYLTVWLIRHHEQHLVLRQGIPITVDFQGYNSRFLVNDATESAQAYFRPKIPWEVEALS